MTKFIDNNQVGDNVLNQTKFTHQIKKDGFVVEVTEVSPDCYEIVEYLGKSHRTGLDFFRARNTGTATWGFFLGVKGDEFNNCN